MNTENKKIHVGKKEIRLFIDDKLYPSLSDNSAGYEFEREFAKTRKNRSFKLVLIMAGVIALSGVFLYFFSGYIDKKNKNITVAIDAFEDLNLMKLLDRVGRTESELSSATAEQANLEARYQSDLTELQNLRDSEIFTLNALNLAGGETSKQRNTINTQYEAQKRTITADYTEKQQELEQTISELKEQLADIDSTNVQRAQEQQAAIDSQRQLFDLEKQQITVEYETQLAALNKRLHLQQEENLKAQKKALETVSSQYQRVIDSLDPVIKDERGNRILERLQTKQAGTADFSQLQNLELTEQETQLAQSVQNAAEDLQYMASFVTSVPQKHNVPAYARAMLDLGMIITGDGAKLLSASFDLLQKEQQQTARLRSDFDAIQRKATEFETRAQEYEKINGILSQHTGEMESYLISVLNASGDAGVILDVRNQNRFPIFISPLYGGAAENAEAYVVNRAGDLVGQITLVKENGNFYAVPAENAEAQIIKVNDRILLQLMNK